MSCQPEPVPGRYGHCQVCRKENDLRRLGPTEDGTPLWACFGCVLAEGYDTLRERLRGGLALAEAEKEAHGAD